MISIAKYFKLEELVPAEVITNYQGDRMNLWLLFDSRVIWTNDKLRMRYGKMVMNTYFWGGSNQYRGFRPWNAGVGAELSQHKFGRASDLVPVSISVEEIRQDIRAHPDLDEFKYIRAVENNTNWLHYDVRNWIGPVLFINP